MAPLGKVPEQTDVFVVGGGPAGLAAAIALRCRGFQVTVADSAHPPIDKACGEGLMPDALGALARLGVSLGPEHSFPFRGIRFLGDGVSVDASFPRGCGLGVRRTRLHQALIDRALQTGVSLLWGASVRGISDKGAILDHGIVSCRWIVGADGLKSRVRQWIGLRAAGREVLRFGFRRHYEVAPWSDCVEIYWGSGSQIYVTPVGPRDICVAAISRDPHLRLDRALSDFPGLAARLNGVPPISSERGAVSASRRLRRVFRGNTILVGDASGSVDAITGEGLRLGFEQAFALAGALSCGDLSAYEAAHRRLARRPALMANLMLSLDRCAWLRRRVLRALAAEPRIFEKQLAMHVGALSTADFARNGMLPLGRGILAASIHVV
ncbi:MAG TPA: FAD-dependent monooxygenase [Bryobacteraceae bacterium]